jgi:hypothetical protein
MLIRNRINICIVVFFVIIFPLEALSNTKNNLVNWNYVDFIVPLKFLHPKLFFTESISPRLKDNLSQMDVVVLRSQLGYKVTDDLVLSLGHDWRRRFNTLGDYENRIWQQLEYRKNFGKHNFSSRLRFEERMISNHNFRLRLRPRIAYGYQITEKLSVELSDEMLFSFIENNNFEQNRILLNFRKIINDNFSVNLGYQLQHYFSGRNLINHAIVTRLEFFF